MTAPYRPGRRVLTQSERKAIAWVIWGVYFLVYLIVASRLHGEARWWGAGVATALPLLVSWGARQGVARFDRDSAPALASLRRDDPQAAETHLLALRRRHRWPRFLGRIATYNLAQSLLRQGRLDEAAAELSDADRRGGWPTIDAAIAGTLSYVHALRNDVPLAEQWLVEAELRYARAKPPHPFANLAAEVAVELRRGRFHELRRRLDAAWPEIEHSMKGETLRPIRLLRAFGVAQAAGPREAAAVTPLITALHPARPEDFRYLTASWPELDQFIHANLPA